MGTAEKFQVTLFLLSFKQAASSGTTHFVFANRRINRDAMARLGLQVHQIKEIIFELESEDYFNGPSPDENLKDCEVWEFGKIIDGVEVYIKLQVRELDAKNVAICISFHEAEREIRYPFKTKS